MMMNRVLRYYEKPAGVYQGSVFVQLSGGIGPSAITSDKNGVLYIAQYDIRGKVTSPPPSRSLVQTESSSEGKVYVVDSHGHVQSQITVAGPEISGLAIK
jgi:hypothetical protein